MRSKQRLLEAGRAGLAHRAPRPGGVVQRGPAGAASRRRGDCTPRLRRLTPAASSSSSPAALVVPGFASTVISRSRRGAETAPHRLEDAAELGGPPERGRAAAEVDRAELSRLVESGPAPQLGQHRFGVAAVGDALAAAGQRGEVAVAALGAAERKVDVDAEGEGHGTGNGQRATGDRQPAMLDTSL